MSKEKNKPDETKTGQKKEIFSRQCRKCFFFRGRSQILYSVMETGRPAHHNLSEVHFYENYCGHPMDVRIINQTKIFPPTGLTIPESQEKIPCHFFARRSYNIRRKKINTP